MVDGIGRKPSFLLRGGELILVQATPSPALRAQPEEIPVDILFEDEWFVAVNKPAGMVVHAGAGVHSGTLVNALLHRFHSLSSHGNPERPGIVHRLDRFTSGVIIAAKTDQAHAAIARLFASREVRKIYLTVVQGEVKGSEGEIRKPITRDPIHRARMTARLAAGRAASTSWVLLERLPRASYLRVRIGTGRTHQIRVHLASIGHPVIGDRLYGASATWPELPPIQRYFLHAHELSFTHPFTQEVTLICSPLAPELEAWLQEARAARTRKLP